MSIPLDIYVMASGIFIEAQYTAPSLNSDEIDHICDVIGDIEEITVRSGFIRLRKAIRTDGGAPSQAQTEATGIEICNAIAKAVRSMEYINFRRKHDTTSLCLLVATMEF